MKHTRRRIPAVIALVIGLALPILAAAPAGAAPASYHSAHTWWVPVGGQNGNASIQVMTSGPGNITIDNGDTVRFYANSQEPHTVTFTHNNKGLAAPFPVDGMGMKGVSSATYRAGVNITSYLLSTYNFGSEKIGGWSVVKSFKVTFDFKSLKAPVKIPYYCLVHPSMIGWITVQPTGWRYPHSQGYYNWRSWSLIDQQIAKGYHRWGIDAGKTNNHLVYVGDTVDMADLMFYIHSTQYINEGQSITFKNVSMEPHTVTFGTESTTCAPDNGPQCDIGTTPGATHATYKGGRFNVWLNPGQSITITFDVSDGTFKYHCALHDYMGMTGKVVVY